MSEPAVTHRFWREAALPQFEARSVADGRKVCYAKHAHETFSIGAITAGACDYFNGKIRRSEQGALVLMNPAIPMPAIRWPTRLPTACYTWMWAGWGGCSRH